MQFAQTHKRRRSRIADAEWNGCNPGDARKKRCHSAASICPRYPSFVARNGALGQRENAPSFFNDFFSRTSYGSRACSAEDKGMKANGERRDFSTKQEEPHRNTSADESARALARRRPAPPDRVSASGGPGHRLTRLQEDARIVGRKKRKKVGS